MGTPQASSGGNVVIEFIIELTVYSLSLIQDSGAKNPDAKDVLIA